MRFDFELIERAAILTGIGMGTAFSLLLLLMIVTALTGWGVRRFENRGLKVVAPPVPFVDTGQREKALAAVVAVAALLSRKRGEDKD